jgi:hypothetical protein
VNGRTQSPPGFSGETPESGGFTVAVDREAAQVTLCGRATGAAGSAYLTPAPGVELAFDRAGGWLSRVTVTVSQAGHAAPVEAIAWIAGVFGSAAAAAVRDAANGTVPCAALHLKSGTLGALSRLARLCTARVTSPVPASRLWAAEAAELARRAGLLLPDWALSAAAAPAAVPAAARNLGPAIPAAVLRLLPGHGPRPGTAGLLDAAADTAACAGTETGGQVETSLDLRLVPSGVFRPGLWPAADLTLRPHQDGAPLIAVEAAVLPGVSPADLDGCRVRLVDAGRRQVLATAAFRVDASLRARAELPAPCGLRSLARSGAVWAEVVGDERRPVEGVKLRRIRRALRWADAALRAQSGPSGLAPEFTDEQWTHLATLAWDHCRADWDAAGDPGRAALASPGAAGPARPFLAELLPEVAVGPLGADDGGEHPLDVRAPPEAALVYRRRRGLRGGEPRGVGGGQGVVELGVAGRTVLGQHLPGHGEDRGPVPVRVGRAGRDQPPPVRLVAPQQLPAGVVEHPAQSVVLRRRRGQQPGAARADRGGGVLAGDALVGHVLAQALGGVEHHPVEVAAQVVDGPVGGCSRHDVPGLLEQVLGEIAPQPLRVLAHDGIGPDLVQLVVPAGRGRLPAVSRRLGVPGPVWPGVMREVFTRHVTHASLETYP